MSGLHRVVDRARGALQVPYPAKAEILEELAADAEALYAHFRRQGHDEASATREVEARLGVHESAAAQLAMLHRSLYARLVERYAAGREMMVEIALLVVTAVVLLGAGIGSMTRLNLLGASPLPWLVLFSASGAWLAAAMSTFRIVVRGETRIERMRRGMLAMPALSLVAFTAAGLSAVLDLHGALPPMGATGQQALAMLIPWVRDSTALLGAGLATAAGTGIVWFLLQTRIAAAERVECRLASGLAWTVITTGAEQ